MAANNFSVWLHKNFKPAMVAINDGCDQLLKILVRGLGAPRAPREPQGFADFSKVGQGGVVQL